MKNYPNYRVAVEAVVRKNRKILLTKRADDCIVAPGVWNVPAGKVKYEEIPADGVIRECKEEIGVDVEIIKELNVRTMKSHFNGEDIYRLVYTYLVQLIDDNQELTMNEEHSEFAWVDVKEIHEARFDSLLSELKQIICEGAF